MKMETNIFLLCTASPLFPVTLGSRPTELQPYALKVRSYSIPGSSCEETTRSLALTVPRLDPDHDVPFPVTKAHEQVSHRILHFG